MGEEAFEKVVEPFDADEEVEKEERERREAEQSMKRTRWGKWAKNREEDVTREQDERIPREVREVKGPTREQYKAHILSGHNPYRPWCQHCVAGQGRTNYHREVEREVLEEVPVVAMDYGFLGARGTVRRVRGRRQRY